jgi:xylan 1,4-beta-xylosidase
LRLSRVDTEHGDFTVAYRKVGSPGCPTVEQIDELKRATSLPEPEIVHVEGYGQIRITIPPNGIALLELA